MEFSPLSAYVQTGTRAALDNLIRAHIDFVYAAAVRQLHDPHLAADVTQAVFLVLAKRAKSIHNEAALPTWLFKTTRYAAANAIKMEQRRRKHEQAAAAQRPESPMLLASSDTNSLLPLLDVALADLGHADRQIILLRYLQSRPLSDVAAVLSITEPAARKRLSRAVDRLRQIFTRRGHTIESTFLTTTLAAAAVHSAPAHLTATILSATPSTAATTIAQGLHWVIISAQAKTIAVIAILTIVLAAGATRIITRSVQQPIAIAPPLAQPVVAPIPPPDQKGPFEVICLNPAGQPVPSAQVYLAQTRIKPNSQHDVVNSILGPITTDAAGISRFDTTFDRNLETYMFYARLPGKLVTFSSRYSLTDPSQPIPSSLTLSMVTSYTFHSSVTMPAGFNLQSAKVVSSVITLGAPSGGIDPMLFRNAPPTDDFLAQFYDTSVKPDGSFSITDVPSAGNLYLTANAPGLAETQAVTPASGFGPAPILAMPREATIGGMVTTPDGTPIPNVAVQAVPLGDMESQHDFSATTNAHGIYIIHGLPGIYVGLYTSTDSFTMPVLPLRLTTSTAIVEDLHLQTGTLVTGLATDTQGKPLPSVGIDATVPAGIAATLTQATSDATGHYTLRLPSGKANLNISSPPDGYDFPNKRDSQKNITIPQNATTLTGPTWRLPRAKPELPVTTAILTGRVVDEHGAGVPNLPLEDATVEGPNNPIQIYPTVATTDSTGRYSASVTANLRHMLYPNSDDFDSPKTRSVTPQSGEKIEFPDLTVHARPIIGTISCLVTDPQKHPLDNFMVSTGDMHGWHQLGDPAGRFTVSVRHPQTLLILSKSGYKYRNWYDIPANARDVHLTLYPESDAGPDYRALTPIPAVSSLLNRPAPPLHVDWIGAHQPTTTRTDGKMTVIAFDFDGDPDSDQTQKFVTDLSSTCVASNAVALIIFTPQATDAGVCALFPDPIPSVTLGIDQFFAAGNPNDPTGTTLIAYGAPKTHTVYVLSPDGTLIYTQQGLKNLDAHLLN